MAENGVCDACRRHTELWPVNTDRLCVECKKDFEEYMEHQYDPEYSGIVDCLHCGYPNAQYDVSSVECNGQRLAMCKECPTVFVWPNFWRIEQSPEPESP